MSTKPEPAEETSGKSKVPDCHHCGNPLGLYFSDCPVCAANAHSFSFWDYYPESGESVEHPFLLCTHDRVAETCPWCVVR